MTTTSAPRRFFRQHGACLLLSLLLAGCQLPHEPVAVSALATDRLGLDDKAAPAIASDWWTAFGDPQLDRIVGEALAGNPTLDLALARVRSGVALVAVERGATLPEIGIDANEQVQRLSGAYMVPPPYGGSRQWVGDVQANLGWNLDFWGRQAAAIRRAAAAADAARLDQQAARLAITASVVQAYLELGRNEQRQQLARQMVSDQQQLHSLVVTRVASELEPESIRHQADARLAMAQQTLLRLEGQHRQIIHVLALLAGQGADYYQTVEATRLQLSGLPPLPAELPADLLSRRPDVLSARAQVQAATAGRDVARRDYYPNVNLLGLVGLQAMGFGKLFSSDAATAGAGAAIHLPIFEGGRLRAGYAAATANVDAAIASYNQTVLGAVREAADRLTDLDRLAADRRQQGDVVKAMRELRNFSTARFDAGLDTRIAVVETGLDLLGARQQMSDLDFDQAVARVQLLVALGGGEDTPVPVAGTTDVRTIR